jgi:hypothetical protein
MTSDEFDALASKLRDYNWVGTSQSAIPPRATLTWEECKIILSALRAALAQDAEPVAVVSESCSGTMQAGVFGEKIIPWHEKPVQKIAMFFHDLPLGTKLYTRPAPAAAQCAVLEGMVLVSKELLQSAAEVAELWSKESSIAKKIRKLLSAAEVKHG